MDELNENTAVLTKSELEIKKIKLENEKIALENKELKRSFWKKPQWFAPAITAFISFLSAVFLFANGVFDKKYQQYKAEKAGLELDIKKFEKSKDSISNVIQAMKDSLAKLNDTARLVSSSLNQIQKEKEEMEDDYVSLQKNLKTRDQIVFSIRSEKQQSEKIMRDSIISLEEEIRELRTRSFLVSINHQELGDKYNQCLVSNEKLRQEIENLKKIKQ
jgi:KaiC/GvpD/RAD55 family RecA-like ATPase